MGFNILQKKTAKAFAKFNALTVRQRAKLLMRKDVKSRKTVKGKFNKMIKLLGG